MLITLHILFTISKHEKQCRCYAQQDHGLRNA